jgi:hypothetical protein
LKNAKCAVSGSGNVAQYAADMLLKLGAKVITMSDSDGVLVFPNGMTRDDWEVIIQVSLEEEGGTLYVRFTCIIQSVMIIIMIIFFTPNIVYLFIFRQNKLNEFDYHKLRRKFLDIMFLKHHLGRYQ